MHLRTTRRIRQEIKLYDPIGADREGNEISLMDILSSDQDEVLDAVVLNIDRDRLAERFHCLSLGSAQCWNSGLALVNKRS